MTNPNNDDTWDKAPLPPPPEAGDFESQTPAAARGGAISDMIQRWKMADFLKRISLVLHGFGFIFSLLAFIIMASNKHGYGLNFDQYEAYRYLLAIAILSTLYTGLQDFRQVYELSTSREIFPWRNFSMFDFIGDQIMAYLLISAASTGVPLTNVMRKGGDNIFTDSSAAAISMEFFAFFSLALSALVSGYKLSHQTYI